jgi:hypothetical protein
MSIPDVPVELFTAFNKVTYFDEPHKYFIGNRQLISVTTLIGKFTEEFEEDYWANRKGYEYNLPKEEMLHLWKYINKVGVTRGSVIHDYAENLFNNKVFPYPKERIEKEFGCDPILDTYLRSRNHVDEFYRKSKGRLIPIKAELVVCDEELGIGGMVDLLFYNIRAREFQIWDWKTNKSFSGWSPEGGNNLEEGKANFTGGLSMLKDNDLNHYSLQLDMYKYIIEKNTGIKLGQSYLIWVSHNQPKFHTIKTVDRMMYVERMINSYCN